MEIINNDKLDIVSIIENTSVDMFTKSITSKIIDKISKKFTTKDQQIFIASFYCFLNHQSKIEFIIDFDTVWKWCGFSRKDHAKTCLEKHFTRDIDYIISAPAVTGAGNDDKKTHRNLGGSGLNKEKITLSINTFKKFCLKAGTKRADEIHDYYINLEELIHEITLEEHKKVNELNNKLELEKQISENIIKDLNKRIERKQRDKYERSHCVYILSNDFFKGYYKIGKSSSFNNRLNTYATGAPNDYKVDFVRKVRNKGEESTVESMVLQILSKFRVKNHMDQDREWLYGVKLDVIMKEMNNCIKFINDSRDKYKDCEQVKIDININEDHIDNQDDVDKVDNFNEKENYVEPNDNDEEDDEDDDDDDDEDEDELKSTKVKKVYNSKYNIDNIKLREKNDPTDFDKFILECCETGDEYHVIQSDLKLAFKIWGRTPLDMIQKHFMCYMNSNFKDTRIFIDNQRRHVFTGLKLKPLTYIKTLCNFDFEEFIDKECSVDFLYKISYLDFMYFFTEWKKKEVPDFKLNKYDELNIKEVLESFFCRGRVLTSSQSKTKNLVGILGLGIRYNNFGIVDTKRQNKIVKEFDVKTKKLLKEYDSIFLCAKEINIPYTTFSNYVRDQTVIRGKYYELA
jgi:hypothetical protein